MIFWIMDAVLIAYFAIVIVKIQAWGRRRAATRALVGKAANADIYTYRTEWMWRYDYLRNHGSIWRYIYVPRQRYDSLYPEKHFITPGVGPDGRPYESTPSVKPVVIDDLDHFMSGTTGT